MGVLCHKAVPHCFLGVSTQNDCLIADNSLTLAGCLLTTLLQRRVRMGTITPCGQWRQYVVLPQEKRLARHWAHDAVHRQCQRWSDQSQANASAWRSTIDAEQASLFCGRTSQCQLLRCWETKASLLITPWANPSPRGLPQMHPWMMQPHAFGRMSQCQLQHP